MSDKPKNENALIKIDKKAFDEALKNKMISKYLDDVLDLRKALQRCWSLYSKLKALNQQVEDGNWEAVEKYKKLKNKISNDLSIEDES